MSALARKFENLSGETRHMLLVVAVMLAAIIQIIDTTIANVALPHMQGSMSVTQDKIAWVLTSYIMATAITMPGPRRRSTRSFSAASCRGFSAPPWCRFPRRSCWMRFPSASMPGQWASGG